MSLVLVAALLLLVLLLPHDDDEPLTRISNTTDDDDVESMENSSFPSQSPTSIALSFQPGFVANNTPSQTPSNWPSRQPSDINELVDSLSKNPLSPGESATVTEKKLLDVCLEDYPAIEVYVNGEAEGGNGCDASDMVAVETASMTTTID